MKKLIITFLIFYSFLGKSQIINTLAGNGISGYSGDGGNSTLCEVNKPIGIATDASGNLYIADSFNNRVRKINQSGIIVTIAGVGTQGFSGDGGLATLAQLSHPSGVAFDTSGNIYIADINNNRIRKIDINGIISTFAGNGTAGYTGDGVSATLTNLNLPLGVAVDRKGNVFIADQNNNRIRMVDASGIISTFAGNGVQGFGGDGASATSAKLYHPTGVAFDQFNNLYIADYNNLRIRKVDTTGIISTVAGNGSPGFFGDGGAATFAKLTGPEGVAADSLGNIYIADSGNNRIRKVDSTGVITTFAGNGIAGYSGDGGLATLASLNSPTNATLDKTGNLYIADFGNNRIRSVTAVVSVNEVNFRNKINFYPNPCKDYIILENNIADQEITIADIMGCTLLTKKLVMGINNLDLSFLNDGFYFINTNSKLPNGNKLIITK